MEVSAMKAMVLEKYGDSYAFVQRDVKTPSPSPGQVLIKVVGSSVNPIDNKIVTLGNELAFAPALPAILGMDVSGIVEETGSGMSRFYPGDRVFGCAGGLGFLPGALAEYMVVDERLIAPAPVQMDLADAATVPLVSITAWIGLFTRASLKEGQKLLVHAGAGGVGHMAVQLGVHAGAEVYATVSSDAKAAVVEEMGGIPINYNDIPVDKYVKTATDGEGFDVVFDTVGGKNLDASFKAAAKGGQVVSTVTRSVHDLSIMHAKGLSLHVVFMLLPMLTGEGRALHGQILTEVAGLVDEGKLAVLLDEARFEYTQIAAAHRHWASGDALGKISIIVSS
ncbi:zinc-dependent alcohol dehydrogenase family protein [Pseudodesulfovibrio sp.]|nr:zinc-dependent alcohol dehydrogenase family protein [Pseudodesulfovibrio sp.]